MKKVIYCFAAILLAFGFSMTADAAEAATESAMTAVAPKNEYKVVKFDVPITCENCKKKVVENISFEKGVKKLEVSVENKTVTITYDQTKTDEEKLAAAIRKLGYTVNGK